MIFASKMAVKKRQSEGAEKKKNGKSNDLPFFFEWCGRWDLNPHVIDTRTSNVPVCLFQHSRIFSVGYLSQQPTMLLYHSDIYLSRVFAKFLKKIFYTSKFAKIQGLVQEKYCKFFGYIV